MNVEKENINSKVNRMAIICNHKNLAKCLIDWLKLFYPEFDYREYDNYREIIPGLINYNPEFIILDTGLNPDNYIKLIKSINKNLSNTELIVTSSFEEKTLIHSLKNENIDFLIYKHNLKTELIKIINSLLNNNKEDGILKN